MWWTFYHSDCLYPMISPFLLGSHTFNVKSLHPSVSPLINPTISGMILLTRDDCDFRNLNYLEFLNVFACPHWVCLSVIQVVQVSTDFIVAKIHSSVGIMKSPWKFCTDRGSHGSSTSISSPPIMFFWDTSDGFPLKTLGLSSTSTYFFGGMIHQVINWD